MANKIDDSYKTSKDYNSLWNYLMNNHILVCFIDYKDYSWVEGDEVFRDIAKIKKQDDKYITISARGIGYDSSYLSNPEPFEQFLKDCNRLNLSFIEPNKSN